MIITSPNQITPAYLTQSLTASGALAHGSVASVAATVHAADWSSQIQLVITYSVDATGALPTALRMKLCQGTFGRSEIDYVSRDYADLPAAPIPRWYDAQFDQELGAYHLLMDDLAATHENNWQRPPDLAYAEALADTLALLHAHYVQPQQRAKRGISEPTAADIERYIAHIQQGLQPLLEHAANILQPDDLAILHTVFAKHPALMVQRLRDERGITLVHGDVNPGNVLAARVGVRPLYILDRQPFDWSLTAWLGVSDITYAIATWWPVDLRRAFEQPMLRRYHAALQAHGVNDYSWEQLWHDYRLCAVQSLYVAVEWCVLPEDRERMRWVWQPELEKALTVFRDLQCAEMIIPCSPQA